MATEKLDSQVAPHVSNILRALQSGVSGRDLDSIAREIEDDVRVCGLFLSHLGYRSPQWIGEEFFAGMDALRLEAERTGKDATAVVYDSNMELIQSGDLDLVSCDLDEPAFVVGDCGPFICRDTEPGVNSERRKPDAQEWAPAEQGMWMALHCESNVCSLDGIRSQGAGTWNRRIRLASHRAFHAHVHFAPDASRQGTPRTRCGNR